MFHELIASPIACAVAICILALANYVVGLWAVRVQSKQTFIDRTNASPHHPIDRPKSDRVRLVKPFILTVPVILLTFVLDIQSREAIVGGWFVMHITGLGANIETLLTARSLNDPSAAEGHIRYSAGFDYHMQAARYVGLAVIAGAVAVMFWSSAFAIGSVWLLAAALGWYRRAGQAADSAGTTT